MGFFLQASIIISGKEQKLKNLYVIFYKNMRPILRNTIDSYVHIFSNVSSCSLSENEIYQKDLLLTESLLWNELGKAQEEKIYSKITFSSIGCGPTSK